MCSDCSDFEPECSYCGVTCYGECEDPDRCPSCWFEEYFGDYDPEPCLERDGGDECKCDCHEEDIEAWKDCFSGESDSFYEELKAHANETANPRLRPGIFPFLKLPGELRDKVYHYNLKQHGSHRKSFYYRGTIETALLGTCRQINSEARHLPLSINTFSFPNPFQAYRFLGFGVLPSQKQLVKSVHIDVHGIGEFHGIFGQYLMPQLVMLSSMSLSHLSITLQGRIGAEWFTKTKCLETCLVEVKGLAKFDLVIGSGVIEDATKDKIVEALRKKLLKASEPAKNPLKRKADTGVPVEDTAVPALGTKKVARRSLTAKSRKTTGRKAKPKKSTVANVTTEPDPETVTGLKGKYHRLEQYARKFDPEATSVKIRLERAYDAASEGKDKDFKRLAEDVLGTLETQFASIAAARNLVLEQSTSPLQ